MCCAIHCSKFPAQSVIVQYIHHSPVQFSSLEHNYIHHYQFSALHGFLCCSFIFSGQNPSVDHVQVCRESGFLLLLEGFWQATRPCSESNGPPHVWLEVGSWRLYQAENRIHCLTSWKTVLEFVAEWKALSNRNNRWGVVMFTINVKNTIETLHEATHICIYESFMFVMFLNWNVEQGHFF